MIVVKRYLGRNWSVYVDGECVEGGFFDQSYAIDCAYEWKAMLEGDGQRHEVIVEGYWA